jgi:hypothetical protein
VLIGIKTTRILAQAASRQAAAASASNR